MTDPQDPAEALASIRDARVQMLEGMDRYPPAYDVLFGFAAAVMVAWQGLPDPWPLFGIPLIFGFAAWMQRWWKRRFGWWVDAYAPRQARWVSFGMLAVIIVLLLGAVWGREQGPWWLCLVAAAITWPVGVIGSRWWARVWRQELRDAV